MSNKFSQLLHQSIKKLIAVTKYEGEVCSEIIKEEIDSNKPSMIARFGSVEIKAIIYPDLSFPIKRIFRDKVFNPMNINAGFFPANEKTIRKFSEMMIEDMQLLDVLGSWRVEERFLIKHFPNARLIQLNALEPYLQKDPWSEALAGKKILVIHPFNETIESQYSHNREYLFQDKRVLPEFKSLETIKAVQTIAGKRDRFNDWFEALDFMKSEIDKKDFDIAIIGCGAYGFPLAAHVKRLGKKAIHMGGATQILFGIKGKRWIDRENFKSIINDYFVFPNPGDRPEGAGKVEGGCYW